MNTSSFRRTVLTYYRKHGRHTLPWRRTRDPYAVLVSEIMLQQTQVDRVVPYFIRWMRTFPTLQALAKSPLADVLKAWSGLGYNRRAKMLHECAKAIVETYGGKVPQDFAALVSLPGIGSYTAGAIRAFAFNEPGVFIETNIRSALIHHFFPHSQNIPDSKLTPILQTILCKSDVHKQKIIFKKVKLHPREWYAALMDYGAHIKREYPNPSRRSRHHVRQKRFSGSLREMRGAIVRALMQRQSLQAFKNDARFTPALSALAKEGVLEKRGRSWCIAR